MEVEIEPSVQKKSYKLKIDFGRFGIKTSIGRFTNHDISDIKDMLCVAVLNFKPVKLGDVLSEVLVLGVQYPKADSGEATFLSPMKNAKMRPLHNLLTLEELIFFRKFFYISFEDIPNEGRRKKDVKNFQKRLIFIRLISYAEVSQI